MQKLVIAISGCKTCGSRMELARKGWVNRIRWFTNLDYFFFIGSDDPNGKPYREGDIVYLPCLDKSDHQTQKTRLFCQYINSNYDFDYLMRCDDDTYIQVERLANYNYQGNYIGNNHGHRCRKWYKNGMHDYAHGGAGYILSKEASKLVYPSISSDTISYVEDLIVGKIMQHYQIPLVHDFRFQYEFDTNLVPKPTNDIISCHYVTSEERLHAIQEYW